MVLLRDSVETSSTTKEDVKSRTRYRRGWKSESTFVGVGSRSRRVVDSLKTETESPVTFGKG